MPGHKVDHDSVEKSRSNGRPPNMNLQEQLYQRKREKEENDWIARFLKPYSSFLVKYPSVVVTLTLLILVLSIVLSVLESTNAKPLPDFSNPVKGYQAKGTLIANRNISRYNLKVAYRETQTRRRRSVAIQKIDPQRCIYLYPLVQYVNNLMIFYKSADGGNLFDQMTIICEWYNKHIRNMSRYPYYVHYDSNVHSIPSYIMLLNNLTDCNKITKYQVDSFVALLSSCSNYYKNGTLSACMNDINQCNSISNTCRSHVKIPCYQDMATLLHNVFHYLGHITLQDNPSYLQMTGSFTGLSNFNRKVRTELFQPIYENTLIDLDETEYKGVKIAGYSMWGLKFEIFKTQMIVQSALLAIAIIIVILLTWFFSGSIFLGLMTLGCILIAMIIAYFVYSRVFDLNFFPFLNMTVLIFIIGIGADDVFVYTGIWQEAKYVYKIQNVFDPDEHIEYMIKWTSHSLRHAVMAMFVTSLTTAAAFFANMTSDVVAVKCFGLFAGTAIIINYMLMVTFFPCTVILHDKYFSKCMHCICPCCCKKYAVPDYAHSSEENIGVVQRCDNILTKMSNVLFNEFLPKFIYNFRYFFAIVFFMIGVGGVVVTFGSPGLNPPTTDEFQFFSSSHSLEQYDLVVKRQFAFGLGTGNYERTIHFVFGINAVDTGYKFDPDDTGTLELRSNFNISNEQIWLKQFCYNVRSAPFYVSSSHCDRIIKQFDRNVQPCQGLTKCCNRVLPVSSADFHECLRDKVSRPLFINGEVKAFSINVLTSYKHTVNYQENKRFVKDMEEWVTHQMGNMSYSHNKGWWTSQLIFYDLQNSLFEGTKYSLGISVAVAFVVILATSYNILLSLFSIVTILFIISTTVGTLILDGWHLNILESTVLSVAAGLSADFTLHYSVAYKSSLSKETRKERVEYALSHIGPAVFMGAITTFIAGLVMIPSTVLSYTQFGTFLMVVMFFSWLYSNFFFLPLCAILGPIGYCGQLTCKEDGESNENMQMEAAVQVNDSANGRTEVLI